MSRRIIGALTAASLALTLVTLTGCSSSSSSSGPTISPSGSQPPAGMKPMSPAGGGGAAKPKDI